MNRRGVEIASAFLLLAGTLGGCIQKSNFEYNTQARAAETARWQDIDPGSIYLGSVIITPDPELKVRSFPRITLFDPDNIISWANIVRINGLRINGNKFLIKYPALVYGPNLIDSSDLTNPNNAPWIQLDAEIAGNGKFSTQKVYISFSDNPRDYMQLSETSNRKIAGSLSNGSKKDGGFQLHSTGEVMPGSEINQVSVCTPDSPCAISPNESAVLAEERFLRRIRDLTYRFRLIIGSTPGPNNNYLYNNKEEYFQSGQNEGQMPQHFGLTSEIDTLGIALSEGFSGGSIKNAIMLFGVYNGRDISVCSPQSEEKTAAYEALLDNFVPNGVVDRRLLSTLAQGATSCVTR